VVESLDTLLAQKLKPEWPAQVKQLKFRTKYLSVAKEILGGEECAKIGLNQQINKHLSQQRES
jgi:hypothetical protein